MRVLSCLASLLVVGSVSSMEIRVPANSPMSDYAAERIKAAGSPTSLPNIEMRIDAALGEQAFTIEPSAKRLLVVGGDERGLLYAGLELAERLSLGESIKELRLSKEPYIKRRGLKMNIPLDARAPSYDDSGTSARMNIEQVWSMAFWTKHLDRMAEHRYNTLTLWNNHPFSVMLKLDRFPEVALDDIAVPTYPLNDHMLPQYMEGRLQEPGNYTVIKKMTIDEKVDFWRAVMRHAKNRGIDVYFITWNIWVHGAEGKYGINSSQTNPITVDYMRESVKQFVLTYPDLKGMGITCGEHMNNELAGDDSVERWMWNTYGQGILDAKAEQPGREVHFIHRVWYSGMDVMMDDFISKYPDQIDLGFKYAKARLYSINNPSFFRDQLQSDCETYGLKCWMNLRNDDLFTFRWGDPEYVRGYMENLPNDSLLAGYHMGSDGYVWGREFTSTEPEVPRQLEIDKHWYKFMLWGRLGYDPALGQEFFEHQLKLKFPEVDAAELYGTWKTASAIVPLINTWHWRDWDHMWSVETCMSKKEGYHSVDHFIEYGPLAGQGMRSIRDHVANPKADGMGPLGVAHELDRLASETLLGVDDLRAEGLSKELRLTLGDLEAFARIANYYAEKIRGSLYVHLYRTHGEKADKKAAVKHLKAAVKHWEEYAEVAESLYEVQLLARVSYTDWNGLLLEKAKDDVSIAKKARHGEFPPSVHHLRIKAIELGTAAPR